MTLFARLRSFFHHRRRQPQHAVIPLRRRTSRVSTAIDPAVVRALRASQWKPSVSSAYRDQQKKTGTEE